MAGRPRTPIGTWGDISVRRIDDATHEAHARFRDADGRLRAVTARGPSVSAAKGRLRDRLAARAAAAAPAAGIGPNTTISDLCTTWLDKKTGDILPQSIDLYRHTIDGLIGPRIGEVTLIEATPGRVATFLDGVPDGQRNRCRTILSQAFALALSHDAVAMNPVAPLPKKKDTAPDVVVLAPAEFLALRAGVADWMAGRIDDDGHPVTKLDKRSVGRAHDLLDFVDMLAATGARTGEIAALRWCDVDLDADTPTVTIAATMVVIKGQGLVRQEHTKARDVRELALPPFAVQLLAGLRAAQMTPIGIAPVFPTVKGGHRSPANIRRQWRTARRAAGRGEVDMWSWVEFRTLRRSVATLVDIENGDEDAAAQLGHASTAMTRRHYIAARAKRAPDLTAILQRFAG